MGVKNYLIDGVSGAGKTTVAEALEQRGYHVVHGDRVLAYPGDPETGTRLPPFTNPRDINAHHIWDVEKVKAIIADRTHPVTFFCGASRNAVHFIDLFDEVFVLDIDRETLLSRLRARPEDEFGGRADEQALILELHESRADLPEGALIDSSPPVDAVVDAILARCANPALRHPRA